MSLKFNCFSCDVENVTNQLRIGEQCSCQFCGEIFDIPETAISEYSQVGDLASYAERFVARLIDNIISISVTIFLVLLFLVIAGKDYNAIYLGIVIFFLSPLLSLTIQAYYLTLDGQSIGKKILRIKIVKHKTEENRGFVYNVFIREFVNDILNIMPFYGLIDTLFIFTKDRRCIHDHLANTSVVKVR